MTHTNYIAIISVLSTLIFTACTPAPTLVTYRYWHKEGVSTKQTQDTLGHCRYDVGANDLSSEKANPIAPLSESNDDNKLSYLPPLSTAESEPYV